MQTFSAMVRTWVSRKIFEPQALLGQKRKYSKRINSENGQCCFSSSPINNMSNLKQASMYISASVIMDIQSIISHEKI